VVKGDGVSRLRVSFTSWCWLLGYVKVYCDTMPF